LPVRRRDTVHFEMLFKIVPRGQVRRTAFVWRRADHYCCPSCSGPGREASVRGRRPRSRPLPPERSRVGGRAWARASVPAAADIVCPRAVAHYPTEGAVAAGNLTTVTRLLPHAQLPGLDDRALGGREKRSACSAAQEGSEGARERAGVIGRPAAAPADIRVSARWRMSNRVLYT
jgi:hypothetical protein